MAKLTQFETSPESSANMGPSNGANGHLDVSRGPAVNGNGHGTAHTGTVDPTLAAPGQKDQMASAAPVGSGGPLVTGPVVEDTYVFPASREQTRYWMLAQLDPESTASNMAIAFELEGEVSDTLVEGAIAGLTMRHEALRTIFRLEAGVLSQVVLARPLYRFTVEDLTMLAGDEQSGALEATVSRHGHTVIDLENGPVLHAHLVHLDQRRHVMALTMNHIVCDGWSNGLLIRDFTVIYEALVTGTEPLLPELPFQFADFSLWQNEYLASPAADEAAAFWKSHITSDLLALDMPTDRPRPAGRSFPGHIESALLPKEIDDKLKAYCRNTGSTKHIVLLAAFEALCARYTGQSEFLLGSTIANRTQPGMEDVVGRFANPQIIVAKAGGNPTFRALEQRVRDWETAAYTHQDLPFSRIIEDFQIDQAGATSQFLQVWFLYQKAFMQPQTGRTLRVTPRRSVSGGVDFDLLVSVVERAEGPRIQFEYNTLIFEPARIRGLIHGLIELLGGALEQPDVPLSEIAHVLPPSDVAIQAVADGPVEPAVANPGLLATLAAHATARPDAVASSDATKSLTWRELDDQSHAVAAEVARLNPSVATLVVHLTQHVQSLAALLAGLRLGCQVLPLPAQADAAIVSACLQSVSHGFLLGSQATGVTPGIAYESFAALPGRSGASDESALSQQENTQFLLLTGGAAGATPKFTAVSGAALDRDVAAVVPALHLDKDASILALPAATALDATLDRLIALRSGAELNLGMDPADDAAVNAAGRSVADQVAAHEATYLFATPAQARTISASGWTGDRRVSLLVRGGRLSCKLKSALTLRLKSAVYLCTLPQAGRVAGLQFLLGARASEGFLPFGEMQLVLQNAEGMRLPAGAFGEVCIVQRAKQGAEMSAVPEDSPIRTGYMASSTTAGVLELQDVEHRYIQLRGHRVCLGDIEDAALGLFYVHDAAVLAPTTDSLVLYLAAPRGRRDTNGVLQHLSQALPSHLIPSDVLWVDSLPVAADGHLDTGHLPQREVVEDRQESSLNTLPLNKVEERLASIWKDVLGLRSIDIHKSFFALGGSSLLLVRLFARVNKAFDTSLPITTIFDAQTVAALALMLGGPREMSHLVQVQTAGTKPPLFMIHSYLLYQGLSNSLGPDQPFYGLRELEQDGHLTIEERVDYYTREIRRQQPHGPYHLAGWCAAGPLTVEVARKLLNAGEQVRYLALFDSWLPGYLESIETANADGSWRPYRTVGSKLNYHRNRVRGLRPGKKAQYLWLAITRIARDTRYRIYLHNWERLHRLSEKYHFQLPQFMHNTSLETFSALKEYEGRKLPVRLTLIRASDSREVAGAAPTCGWDQVAEKGVEVLWAPGDHETMFIGKNLQVTSEIVQLGLEASAAQEYSTGSGSESQGAHLVRGVMHVDCPST
jgi:thioesterase domain-containing protein/non-ribosomal peptide synthetase component F/acyl carrier protein